MTLEQLRIFVAVASREHVTQGARDLNLTQSATSAAIAALEARYQTRLFDRIGRRIALTEAGRLFLVEARGVLARAAAAEMVLSDVADLRRGSLAIAASQTVGNYWLPRFLHAFKHRYPGLTLTMRIGNTETVAKAVRDGEADLGFVEGDVEEPALASFPVAVDEMVLIVASGHDWSERGRPSPGALRFARWVAREKGSGTRAVFETVLATLGVTDIDIAMELPTNEAVAAAVEAGAGASILSRLAVASALRAGSLRAVDVKLPQRRFHALRLKERHVTQAERTLLALIAQMQKPDQ